MASMSTRQPDDPGAAHNSEPGRQASRKHGPKLRSRKEGAAVALDDLDRRLLNLMQGAFPIAPHPYQHVADRGRDPRGRGDGARPAAARRADHPPGHTDL